MQVESQLTNFCSCYTLLSPIDDNLMVFRLGEMMKTSDVTSATMIISDLFYLRIRLFSVNKVSCFFQLNFHKF